MLGLSLHQSGERTFLSDHFCQDFHMEGVGEEIHRSEAGQAEPPVARESVLVD